MTVQVRILRATNLPVKDAGSSITGSKGSADCYVKVNISDEELFVERSNRLLNLSHAQVQYSRRFVVRIVASPNKQKPNLNARLSYQCRSSTVPKHSSLNPLWRTSTPNSTSRWVMFEWIIFEATSFNSIVKNVWFFFIFCGSTSLSRVRIQLALSRSSYGTHMWW